MEYLDWMSHVLVGVVAAVLGVFAQRTWARRRWRRAPAALERRTLAAGNSQGVSFVETTGDGCMMTFASVASAAKAAAKLLRGLSERPPDVAPGPALEVRAGIAYGEILVDRRGVRHGAAINKAFRLVSVPADAFVAVEGEERMQPIPDRNRVFLDEDAVHELGNAPVSLRKVGVCRLRGFGGYHRVFELGWRSS